MAELIGEHPGNYRHPSTPVKGEQAATGSPVRFQNLLPPLAPLIGRDQQEQAIRALLLRPAVRLLTLTGTGGIGKTRLAQKVATDLIGVFTHGVCLVQLAPLSDADLVVPTISQTLGLRDVEERNNQDALTKVLVYQTGAACFELRQEKRVGIAIHPGPLFSRRKEREGYANVRRVSPWLCGIRGGQYCRVVFCCYERW